MTDASPELNPEQRAAVEHPSGPLLIIAGAGTGKTRVLSERVAYLLKHEKGLQPENILALTFTERATREMASRIRTRISPSRPSEVNVHTFHSFALKMMQEQSVRLKRPHETELLDPQDLWILLRRNIERLQLEVFWKNAEPGKFLNDLIEFMSRAHDELVSVEDYEAYVEQLASQLNDEVRAGRKAANDADAQLKREREIARVYRVATELLAEAGAQTFGDVIASAVRLLIRFPDVRAHYENRYRAILVDEFQDTNVAQIELLRQLAKTHQNITVVGDDDQAIYRFRGASSESFHLFAKNFPRFRQLQLTRNYRSTKKILRVANQLIGANPDRFDSNKRLWTEKGEGQHIAVLEAPEPDDEAFAVAAEIERQHAAGRPFRDIAVLYRAHRHRELVVRALRRKAVPFQVVRQSVRTNPPIRDLFSLLRLVVRTTDNIACARVISFPRWKITEEEFIALSHERARHSTTDGSGRPSLYETIQTHTQTHPRSALRIKLARFVAWMDSLEKAAAQRPALWTTKILTTELTNPNPTEQRVPPRRVSVFHADALELPMRRVVEFVEAWQKKNSDATMKAFLEYFDLFLEAGGDIYESQEERPELEAVRLMSVHAAKGLEFPIVIVLRLTQGYFPLRRRPKLLEFPEALRKEGMLPPGDFHTQEERRLAYVALTRAKDELILTTVQKPRWKPSVFLSDMQRDSKQAAKDLTRIQVPASGENLGRELYIDVHADEETIAFSHLPFWALRNVPVQSEAETARPTLTLSASSMERYKTCPMQFKFSYGYKLSAGPSAALTFGAVMHECVKQFFAWKKQGEEIPFERLEAFLARRWRSIGFEDPHQEARYRAAARKQLRAFHAKNLEVGVSLLAQEGPFDFPLDDLRIIGRVDQINEDSRGEVELIDYKTGRAKTQQEAEKSFQLSVYALACQEFFRRRPGPLSFYNLENGEKVITQRSAADLEWLRAEIRTIARDIRRGVFPPEKDDFVCSRCEYQLLCPAFEEETSAPIPPLGESQQNSYASRPSGVRKP